MLDHDSYSWSAAAPALKELRRRRIPLIFCTSKTAAEVATLRRKMNNSHPFIAENGGAIGIPARYFASVHALTGSKKPITLVLGHPYQDTVRELKRIARETRVEIRGFHQMNDAEVARETGLSLPDASRARLRETSEPFQFRSASPAAIRRFRQYAREQGYSVQRGGRFWHFAAACDKGLALSVLIGFYHAAWRAPIRTLALGDSGNDLSMLRVVDRPILIPKPDGSYAKEVLAALPEVIHAKQPGPVGWNATVLRELRRNSAQNSSPSNGHAPRTISVLRARRT